MTKRGYKNPPVEHQFQKGKSGNPKGRPRKKKQSSSDPGLDLIASVHRELGKTISVQENGQHREITKLDAFSAQLVAQSVNGKPSQQKMLLTLLMLHKHEETEQQTLEQLLSEIVGTRLSEALSQFRLAPEIKEHELNKAKERLEKLDTKAMLDLITRVDLSEIKAIIQIDVEKVATLIQIDTCKLDLDYLRVEEPVVLRKRTNGSKLTWVGYKGEPNHALIRAIVTAQAWVDEIKAGRYMSDIMQSHKIPEGMIWKRIRLAFLSPKLLQAIVEGTTNRDLSIKMLTKHDLPLEWSQQEALFLG